MGVPPPLGRERVEPALHDAYDRVQSESGTVPNIFRVMAHFPAALKRFIPFYTAVMSQGSVPRKFKELAYLKTAHINACGYCMAAHTHSALEAGVSRAQIDSIRVYQGSDAFDEKERATVRFADLVTRGAAAIDRSVLEWIGTYYSEAEIVELVMVIGLANLVNRFNDALQVPPDPG